jgi:hypothetical protein
VPLFTTYREDHRPYPPNCLEGAFSESERSQDADSLVRYDAHW